MATSGRLWKKKHRDSFHSSIKYLLVFGQICALIPVKGIFGSSLKFTWKNVIHIYAIIVLLVTFFFDACYTIDLVDLDLRIDVFAPTEFYTVNIMTMMFFLEIAKKLPNISRNFANVEKHMMDYGYPKRLGRKVNLFLFSAITIATIEHGALVVFTFMLAYTDSEKEHHGVGSLFYAYHFPSISRKLTYSVFGTIILFWVNVVCTFNWSYLDFFLIVFSIELSSRFALINDRLKNRNIHAENRQFWHKICKDYNRLAVLTKYLDRKFSKVILTSLFSSLYHLSLQLIRTLTMKGSIFQMTYFYFSVAYLLSRLLLVLFFAAQIHAESKKPADKLLELEHPCPEAIRFCHQVLTDDIAFTGSRFFVLNNKFLMSIIGTILTYQGVLLQFNTLEDSPSFEEPVKAAKST